MFTGFKKHFKQFTSYLLCFSLSLLLVGCTDMRTYKYYDFTKEVINTGIGQIELVLIGEFKDVEGKKRITIRGNPYRLLVRYISDNEVSGEMYLEKFVLIDKKNNNKIPLQFIDAKRPIIYRDNLYQAGDLATNLMLDHAPQRVKGQVIIRQGEIELLNQIIDIELKPYYHEERQSDTLSKILST